MSAEEQYALLVSVRNEYSLTYVQRVALSWALARLLVKIRDRSKV